MNQPDTRITSHVEASLKQALSSLTGRAFTVEGKKNSAGQGEPEEPAIWEQAFSVIDAPGLWMMAGKPVWEDFGRLTLESAGVEAATAEDCRPAWQEIVSQTIAGVAAGITADVLREVSPLSGEDLRAAPAGVSWSEFLIGGDDGRAWTLKMAWSEGLSGLYELQDQPQERQFRNGAARESAASKTFDLLLDVALPVSVSFGKTSLQIRDVLKLNTGSIVELNRFVSDPVEVIVNDCVIARGEVVVVEGNYGVRIIELASREERLKTGMTDRNRIGARP